MSACRVLIADDHPLMAEGLQRAISGASGLEVAGVAGSAGEAMDLLERLAPDVVVDDMAADADAGSVLDAANRARRRVRTLVMLPDAAATRLQRLAAGADGLLTCRASAEDVVSAIRVLHDGGTAIDPEVAAEMVRVYRRGGANAGTATATPAAARALDLAVDGLTDDEIGREMGISRRTVQRLLASLRRQAGLRRRADLVRWGSVERTRRITPAPRERSPTPRGPSPSSDRSPA
jgi:DNA-binding NarL/FixJ family response regulator